MSSHLNEQVMVVPAERFDALGRFQGFCGEVGKYFAELLEPSQISFRPRAQVEEDPSYKQIIPYCILHCAGRVFRYTRGKRMGEKRLHALESIGVGGHISLCDDRPLLGGAQDTYEEAMLRELEEEVIIESGYVQKCVGLINDDSTPVGQVHLGIVHRFDLEQPRVLGRESGLTQAGFVTLDELRGGRERLETWSRFCLEALFLST